MKFYTIVVCLILNIQISLSHHLQSLSKDSKYKGLIISYQVCKKDGTIIVEKNPDYLLVGASTWKVFTGLFVLYHLGPEHQPKTNFWVEKENVWIESFGDPSLDEEKIEKIKQRLKITQPLEKVYLKQAYAIGYPSHLEIDDLQYSYAAPITAWSLKDASFSLNWKDTVLTTSPKEEGLEWEKQDSSTTDWDYNPFKKN